jgi:BMFP domain-containing protein YqiC
MTDSARTYFDSFIHLAGDPARRARDLAGKVREDLRSGTETLKTSAEQVREHGTRTAGDIGRLIRAEFDAGLTRMGVATQADLDDLNLRLEHSEEQIRDLRIRLAEAEARLAAADKRTEPSISAEQFSPGAAAPGAGTTTPGATTTGTAAVTPPSAPGPAASDSIVEEEGL